MADLIHIYKNNPTAGGTDGTAVSTGDGTAPVSVTLDASESESKTVRLAIRCDSGYQTTGDTVLGLTGTSAGKWGLSLSENGTYSSTVTITSAIGATNVLFYARATSSNDEAPANDTSVKITATGRTEATA